MHRYTTNMLSVLVALFFTLSQTARAQQLSPEKRTSGPHEGIKVHGHWTIEVRNPDGKLVTHREFENSLAQSAGAATLVSPLDRGVVSGLWLITLDFSQAICPGGSIECALAENPATVAGAFKTLTVAVSGAQTPSPHLILSGSMTAPQNGSVVGVDTWQTQCAATVAPANCLDTNALTVQAPRGGIYGVYGVFTGTVIPPVNVVAGQSIQVTVDISFS